MVQINTFSKGRNGGRNEDYYGYNDSTFIVADGATDKSGRLYENKTGGELISRLVVEACLSTDANGIDLVDLLNKKVAELYKKLGIEDLIQDPKNRFGCAFILVCLVKNKLIITYLGDLGFRVNGVEVYQEVKQVAIDNAKERSKYILQTGDLEGSRAHIMPLLLKQFGYQNNSAHKLGYGVVDGTVTPAKFVKQFEWKLENVRTLELFTDGYFAIPEGKSIEDWEELHERVEEEDPDKFKKYKSTKSKDDRTIMVINFNHS